MQEMAGQTACPILLATVQPVKIGYEQTVLSESANQGRNRGREEKGVLNEIAMRAMRHDNIEERIKGRARL